MLGRNNVGGAVDTRTASYLSRSGPLVQELAHTPNHALVVYGYGPNLPNWGMDSHSPE